MAVPWITEDGSGDECEGASWGATWPWLWVSVGCCLGGGGPMFRIVLAVGEKAASEHAQKTTHSSSFDKDAKSRVTEETHKGLPEFTAKNGGRWRAAAGMGGAVSPSPDRPKARRDAGTQVSRLDDAPFLYHGLRP